MITHDEARRLAEEYIAGTKRADEDYSLVILDEATLEKDFGWVFFYDSDVHQRTQAFEGSLGGNAPLIVTRATGSVHVTGTAHQTEYYIRNFEKYGTPYPPEDAERM